MNASVAISTVHGLMEASLLLMKTKLHHSICSLASTWLTNSEASKLEMNLNLIEAMIIKMKQSNFYFIFFLINEINIHVLISDEVLTICYN